MPAAPNHRLWFLFSVLTLLMVALASAGIVQRQKHIRDLQQQAQYSTIMPVSIIYPQPSAAESVLAVPGSLTGWKEASIRAHINGYLRTWHTDIGMQVSTGDILAQISAPELDQQVLSAEAEVANAKANLDLARITAQRWQQMIGSKSVSEQDLIEKLKDAQAKSALLKAATANLMQLKAQQNYEIIRAPFDGIISARSIDIGDLVQANTGPELFHLVNTHQLRLFVDIPQSEISLLSTRPKAKFEVAQYPGQVFPATFLVCAGGMDPQSRTQRLEFKVDNTDAQLMPGAYVTVDFESIAHHSFSIPVTGLIFKGNGLQAATVQSGHVHLLKLIPGRDYGKTMEILSGISTGTPIINNPVDSIAEGDAVRITVMANEPKGHS